MAVPHTTLLGYLGKYITFKVPCPIEYNESGFDQVSGKVISVCIELNQRHALCVMYDEETDSADFYDFEEMVIVS